MHTDIYKIDDQGEISFVATYSLPPEKALKCAVLQRAKRFDTWQYDKIYIPMVERNGHYSFHCGENQVLFTWHSR